MAAQKRCKSDKIGVGGGVVSHFDPLDSLQYSYDEMKSAVDAAQDFGAYICAHVYYDDGINRAVDAGVKSIEHGHFVSKKTIKKWQIKARGLVSRHLKQTSILQNHLAQKGKH